MADASASPEPTIADVLTVMKAGFAQLVTEQAKTNAKIDAVRDELKADIAQVRADVLGVKVDHGLHEQHQADIQAALAQHIGDRDNHHRHAA
jgi:hypothetical protein